MDAKDLTYMFRLDFRPHLVPTASRRRLARWTLKLLDRRYTTLHVSGHGNENLNLWADLMTMWGTPPCTIHDEAFVANDPVTASIPLVRSAALHLTVNGHHRLDMNLTGRLVMPL